MLPKCCQKTYSLYLFSSAISIIKVMLALIISQDLN